MPSTARSRYDKYLRETATRDATLRELVGNSSNVTNQLLLELVIRVGELTRLTMRDNLPRRNLRDIRISTLVANAGAPKKFPHVEIPHGYKVTIKALSTNADLVYVAGGELDVSTTTSRYELEAGDSEDFQIEDLSLLWLAVETDGEGVTWKVEWKGELEDMEED